MFTRMILPLSLPFVFLSLAACGGGGKGGSGNGNPPAPIPAPTQTPSTVEKPVAEIPTNESEVFEFDAYNTFSDASTSCRSSGYGFALDEDLNKIAICCIFMDQQKIVDNTAKFITRQNNQILVKPEKCDATVVAGSISNITLPINFDLSSQKLVKVDYGFSTFSNGKSHISFIGNKEGSTKVVGNLPLNIKGRATLSDLHVVGAGIEYSLVNEASFNSLTMSNLTIEPKGSFPKGLILSNAYATSIATSGMSLKFDNVKVIANVPNPVLLKNYPFDTSGIEIVAGSQFAPHIGLTGDYSDTTGRIAEKRYPMITNLTLLRGSKLVVGPGVKMKIPSADSAFAGRELTGTYNLPILSFEGSAEERIQITSTLDDKVGGDTNGDGNATTGNLVKLNTDRGSSGINIDMQYADLYGVYMEVSSAGGSTLTLGNVALRAASDGSYHLNPIASYWVGFNYRQTHIILDAPVEAWQPVETYLDEGELKVKSVIGLGLDTAGYSGINGNESVKGIDFLTVHNTSVAPTKVLQDLRVFDSVALGCSLVVDSNGQFTEATKEWVYYRDSTTNSMKRCP